MVKKKSKTEWIREQRKFVSKIFAPKVFYDKEFDILSLCWFPAQKYDFSLETLDDIIFDVSADKDIKGIQIINFKKRFLKEGKTKNARTKTIKKIKRRKP
jgi:hypothetical protein